MNPDLWQKDILKILTNSFQDNKKIVCFAVFGSTANNSDLDYWSDIDGLLVMEDAHYEDFADSFFWIEKFGNLFAYQKTKTEVQTILRLVFNDFQRVDFIIIKESNIDNLVKPENGPFWKNIDIIFSRSEEIKKLLQETKKVALPPEFNNQQFQDLVNNFWFIAVQSLYKDCLRMGMIIRDRETGTNIHKTGGMGNEITKNMEVVLKNITQGNILDILSQCGKEFDKLCSEWDKGYKPRYKDFEKFIKKAKSDVI